MLRVALLTGTLLGSVVSAQWLNYPAPGVPRLADGKPNLSAPAPHAADGKPDLSGVWMGPGAGSYDRNIARDLKPGDVLPWAEKIYQDRVLDLGKDAPRAACLPDPFVYYHMVDVARMVQSPGVIAMLYQGTTQSVHRTIFTDGRPLPVNPNPSWMGYSTGKWEGDALVVETNGFNDRGWLDIEGHPHSEDLKIIERYRRPDYGHLDLEMTIEDPKTFAKPFSMKIRKTLDPDTDLLESICENDRSVGHMVGGVETIRLKPDVLARYVGRYEYAPNQPAVISMDGDLLFLQEGANPLRLPLTPWSETEFTSRTNGDQIAFQLQSGKVTGFRFRSGNDVKNAIRKE